MTTPAITERRSSRSGTRSRRARPFRLTDRDLKLLAFVAAHRFVLAAHLRSWLGTSSAVAYRRLSALVDVGLLSYRRIFHAQPGCYLMTNGGLAVIDSDLSRPAIDLRSYTHDTGVVWLWLAARAGRFGPTEHVLTERVMRSRDQRGLPPVGERFAVPVDGYERSGRPRAHYPDVLIVGPSGGRVALELELSLKSKRRLEDIIVGYGGAPAIRRVVYLAAGGPVERTLQGMVEEVGLVELIDVRPLPLGRLRQPDQPWALSADQVWGVEL